MTPNLPAFDLSKEREQANAAIRTIEQNLTALNLSREWLETHIQSVQKGLSSIQKQVNKEVAKVREARMSQSSQHDVRSA